METVNHLMSRQCKGCRCKERQGFKLNKLGKQKCYSTTQRTREEKLAEIGGLKMFILGLKRLRFNFETWQT